MHNAPNPGHGRALGIIRPLGLVAGRLGHRFLTLCTQKTVRAIMQVIEICLLRTPLLWLLLHSSSLSRPSNGWLAR